jgi:hypothetical protein
MSAFGEVMGVPAWRSLPSWFMVAESDEVVDLIETAVKGVDA